MPNINDKVGWRIENSYAKLSGEILTKIRPAFIKDPKLIIFNKDLAKNLGLDFSLLNKIEIANIFSGNVLPEKSECIAQAYAGHQFGHFTILGDGRAILLGEHLTKNKKRFDIQFKGSGKTPYSRQGDGKAALGPMLREYIVSEALHGLGIPTTRSLAVVATGEQVYRENILKGAILTRVASSHIRVGTFQYAMLNNNQKVLERLLNYTVERHYPEIKDKKDKALQLIKILVNKQCELVINWMRVGFIHGVMNTDNMAISGESIDFGPCAFMDTYSPQTVFSSIDLSGRYSYGNQPQITKWNLARFAESLLPLIDEDKKKSIDKATNIINEFDTIFRNKWLVMMKNKLGITNLYDKEANEIIINLLKWMEINKADFTNTFLFLQGEEVENKKIYDETFFVKWLGNWKQKKDKNASSRMSRYNPKVIPRNYIVEEVLNSANEGNLKLLNDLLKVIEDPYKENNNNNYYQKSFNSPNFKTFCGT